MLQLFAASASVLELVQVTRGKTALPTEACKASAKIRNCCCLLQCSNRRRYEVEKAQASKANVLPSKINTKSEASSAAEAKQQESNGSHYGDLEGAEENSEHTEYCHHRRLQI